MILFILLTGTAPFAAANAEASFAKTLKVKQRGGEQSRAEQSRAEQSRAEQRVQ